MSACKRCGVLNFEKRIMEILSVELIRFGRDERIKILRECVGEALKIYDNEDMAQKMDRLCSEAIEAGDRKKAKEYERLIMKFHAESLRSRRKVSEALDKF